MKILTNSFEVGQRVIVVEDVWDEVFDRSRRGDVGVIEAIGLPASGQYPIFVRFSSKRDYDFLPSELDVLL